jgi:twitching motility protein PilT
LLGEASPGEGTHLQPPREPEINKLFRVINKYQASALHLRVGEPPMAYLRGDLRPMRLPPLSAPDMQQQLYPIMGEQQRQRLDTTGTAFFSHVVGKYECSFVCTVTQKDGLLSLSAFLLGPDSGDR